MRPSMILSFKDVGTEDIFNGENTKSARKTCPQTLFGVAFRKLDQIDSAVELNDLRVPPGNRLEAIDSAIAQVNIAFGLTTSIGSASFGQTTVL